MPKPLKKRAASARPKSDPNEAAVDLVRRSTEPHEAPPPAKDFKAELKKFSVLSENEPHPLPESRRLL
jgi:hypothetical protein